MNLISDNLRGKVNIADNDDNQIINYEDVRNSRYIPQCRKTITYIVGVVLLNDQNQICLIQEAKESCQQKWYLPAGRLEKLENLNEGVMREAKEECGYDIEPLSISSVEIDTFGHWHRFIFIAKITGGKLKTLAESDAESLQAQWFDLEEIKSRKFSRNLRCIDIIQLIDIAVQYYNKYKINSIKTFETDDLRKGFNLTLPNHNPHGKIKYTFIAVYNNNNCLVYSRNKMKASGLVNNMALPSVIYYPNIRPGRTVCSVDYSIKSILFASCFKDPNMMGFKCDGILGIEHDGRPDNDKSTKDGMRFIFLVTLFKQQESNDQSMDGLLTKDFCWLSLENDENAMKTLNDYKNDPNRFVTLVNLD